MIELHGRMDGNQRSSAYRLIHRQSTAPGLGPAHAVYPLSWPFMRTLFPYSREGHIRFMLSELNALNLLASVKYMLLALPRQLLLVYYRARVLCAG